MIERGPAPAQCSERPVMAERVAIVHEWIASRAGSEQVFEELARMWPAADLYALSREPDVPLDLAGRELHTTMLDHPSLRSRRGLTLPLMPMAWRSLGTRDYDLVITSHHAFAASNRLASHGTSLAYVHSPARYVWSPEIDGRGAHPALAPIRHLLKGYDRASAARLTGIAANSSEVRRRIERYWHREAVVIHPPVDTEYFRTSTADVEHDLPDEFVLGLGRWIPYKNHEMVIRVAEELRMPAVIAGSGPLASHLEKVARSARTEVLLVRAPGRPLVRQLLQRAAALIFPTHEDFGMIPVEAMASGTPVVALARGGALETVADGVSGRLVDDHRPSAYAAATLEARSLGEAACRQQADKFSKRVFADRISEWARGHR
jgi:glycosyltransferase involved in cell wall biosynthesis